MSGAIFTMSVDDGHPLDLRLAEMLLRHELQATFYVPVKNCEGHPVLRPPALRELSTNFEIGSHTLSHKFLKNIQIVEALYQINSGKKILEDHLGQPVQGFCYPGGSYQPVHRKMVRSAGFTYARTIQNLRFDAGYQPFELPTTVQFYPHSRTVMLKNFVSQRAWDKRKDLLTVLLPEQDWLERLYLLFDYVCRRGGIFHLWCHSIDIDRLGIWKKLEEFLNLVSHKTNPLLRMSNLQVVKNYCDTKSLSVKTNS
jgi:peptidoglycan/xylan/chitin deacetylase (PgdA/CDA1 family)